jgi:hypothetical protein
VIGHMKTDGHPRPLPSQGPRRMPPTSSSPPSGHNLRLVLGWLRALCRLIVLALVQAFATRSALSPHSPDDTLS